jgi:hypothetical protein
VIAVPLKNDAKYRGSRVRILIGEKQTGVEGVFEGMFGGGGRTGTDKGLRGPVGRETAILREFIETEESSCGDVWGAVKGHLARSERFELPTLGFEVRCSIQLSYERINDFNDLAAQANFLALLAVVVVAAF